MTKRMQAFVDDEEGDYKVEHTRREREGGAGGEGGGERRAQTRRHRHRHRRWWMTPRGIAR